jgi:hypothetical protein
MTLDPDYSFGFLSPQDQEKMELILKGRSEGSYGAPALHGMLTASVVGPKSVPMDWILQTVLSPPESEAIGFDNFPEFSWVVEKTQELLLRIGRVFQQDPEMFHLLVYMPKLWQRQEINAVVDAQFSPLSAGLCVSYSFESVERINHWVEF